MSNGYKRGDFVPEGKMTASVATAEYARDSGKTFDEFFADFETNAV